MIHRFFLVKKYIPSSISDQQCEWNSDRNSVYTLTRILGATDFSTGKSLLEALILASTNPQNDKRLFIDLPVQYMKTTSSEHGENMLCA